MLTGAYRDNQYTDTIVYTENGIENKVEETKNWRNGSAGIWIKAGNVSVKGCVITGNGNGIFTMANSDLINDISSDILIEGCYIYGNGTEGVDLNHNLYLQGAGTTVQFCDIGVLRDGALGSSLKDRSAGTVIRYNKIEAAERLLDLVETEETGQLIESMSSYKKTYVYGNILINDHNSNNTGCGTLFHYGGDKGIDTERDGTLYFYNNTVYINANSEHYWRNQLFESEKEAAQIRLFNNIFTLVGSIPEFNMLDENGHVHAEGGNWITSGWNLHTDVVNPYQDYTYGGTGSVTQEVAFVEGDDAGIVDFENGDFSLTTESPARGIGISSFPSDIADSYPVIYQYKERAIFSSRLSLENAGAVE
jgi:hypothetical protein